MYQLTVKSVSEIGFTEEDKLVEIANLVTGAINRLDKIEHWTTTFSSPNHLAISNGPASHATITELDVDINGEHSQTFDSSIVHVDLVPFSEGKSNFRKLNLGSREITSRAILSVEQQASSHNNQEEIVNKSLNLNLPQRQRTIEPLVIVEQDHSKSSDDSKEGIDTLVRVDHDDSKSSDKSKQQIVNSSVNLKSGDGQSTSGALLSVDKQHSKTSDNSEEKTVDSSVNLKSGDGQSTSGALLNVDQNHSKSSDNSEDRTFDSSVNLKSGNGQSTSGFLLNVYQEHSKSSDNSEERTVDSSVNLKSGHGPSTSGALLNVDQEHSKPSDNSEQTTVDSAVNLKSGHGQSTSGGSLNVDEQYSKSSDNSQKIITKSPVKFNSANSQSTTLVSLTEEQEHSKLSDKSAARIIDSPLDLTLGHTQSTSSSLLTLNEQHLKSSDKCEEDIDDSPLDLTLGPIQSKSTSLLSVESEGLKNSEKYEEEVADSPLDLTLGHSQSTNAALLSVEQEHSKTLDNSSVAYSSEVRRCEESNVSHTVGTSVETVATSVRKLVDSKNSLSISSAGSFQGNRRLEKEGSAREDVSGTSLSSTGALQKTSTLCSEGKNVGKQVDSMNSRELNSVTQGGALQKKSTTGTVVPHEMKEMESSNSKEVSSASQPSRSSTPQRETGVKGKVEHPVQQFDSNYSNGQEITVESSSDVSAADNEMSNGNFNLSQDTVEWNEESGMDFESASSENIYTSPEGGDTNETSPSNSTRNTSSAVGFDSYTVGNLSDSMKRKRPKDLSEDLPSKAMRTGFMRNQTRFDCTLQSARRSPAATLSGQTARTTSPGMSSIETKKQRLMEGIKNFWYQYNM